MQQFAAVCHPERAETNMAAVLKELSGGQTPNRVICCGHSLGGALATLGQLFALCPVAQYHSVYTAVQSCRLSGLMCSLRLSQLMFVLSVYLAACPSCVSFTSANCCFAFLACSEAQTGEVGGAGAAWAALEYPDADIRCITFGSPRVANKVFGRAFSALVGTSLRLVHGFDPVPSLPPSLM